MAQVPQWIVAPTELERQKGEALFHSNMPMKDEDMKGDLLQLL